MHLSFFQSSSSSLLQSLKTDIPLGSINKTKLAGSEGETKLASLSCPDGRVDHLTTRSSP